MPGFTSGWPMAPRKMASNARSSSTAASGRISPVREVARRRRSRSACSLEVEAELLAAAASRTLSASRTTSGPVPSPGITAILYVFPSCLRKTSIIHTACYRAPPRGCD